MKKLLMLFVLFASLFSCTGVKTVVQGVDNEAYIMVVGNPDVFLGGVEVAVDENTKFVAKVIKDGHTVPKGEVYAIKPGKHLVKVSYRGQVLYQQQIFISSQETRKIKL